MMEGGEVKSTAATLTVNLAEPLITNQPVSTPERVNEGTQVTFSIKTSGSHVSFAWLNGGEALTGETTQSTDADGHTTATLTIAASDYKDDNARISCVVSNVWNGQNHSVTSDPVTLDVVLMPPVINTHPVSTTKTEGEEAKFFVKASGSELTYQWRLERTDDTIIPGPTTSEWIIPSVSLKDHEGKISCVVSNRFEGDQGPEGDTLSSEPATLTVNLAEPVITNQPVSAPERVNEGKPVTFTIQAFGSHLSFAWLNGGEALTGETTQSTDADGITTATLTIAESDYKDDNAQITCVVSNAWNGQSHSVTSEPVTLDVVLMSPVINTHPVSTTKTEGEEAKFSVSATGSELTYQWSLERTDDTIIPGPTTSDWIIPSVSLKDHEARITCVVSNRFEGDQGTEGNTLTSEPATLTVNLAEPLITHQPVSTPERVNEGAPVTFTIKSSGSHVSFAWLKGGEPLTGETTQSTDADGITTATLTIAESDYKDDNAGIACVVSNAWNGQSHSMTSDPVTFDVVLMPPVINTHPVSTTKTEGEEAKFSVSATGSELTYQWSLERTDDTIIPGPTTSEWIIPSVSLKDHEGRITCVVSNRFEGDQGSEGAILTSESATLTVNLAEPVITNQPVSTPERVNEGAPVTFTIQASGSHLSFAWLKGGEALTGETTQSTDADGITTATLTIAASDYKDDNAGIACVVSNAWNGQSHSVTSDPVTLDVVLMPPVINTHPVSTTKTEGEEAMFSVSATGSELTYQWSLERTDDTIIPGPTTSEWIIPSVSLKDHEGSITCVVSNRFEGDQGPEGNTLTSEPATLTVNLAEPVITNQPVSTPERVNEGAPVTFTIQVSGSHVSFAWLKGGEALTGEITQSTDADGLTTATLTIAESDYKDDNAQITCVVSNAWNGQSHSVTSEPVTLDVVLMSPVINTHPVSTTKTEGEEAKFSVKATGSELTYQWSLECTDDTIVPGPTTSEWIIPSVSLKDHEARITCVVSNRFEGDQGTEGNTLTSEPATLTVNLAEPVITNQPVSTPERVNEGDSVTFTIKSSGSHLGFAWLKGGEALTGETNQSTDADGLTTATLTIAESDYKDDNALITCVVSNAWNGQNHSVTSDPVTLDVVLISPVINTHPVSTTKTEGEEAKFSVSATGSELTYQWSLECTDDTIVPGPTTSEWIIPSVSLKDHEARITCVVSNRFEGDQGTEGNTLTSEPATLTVNLAEPVITNQPVSAPERVNEGKPVTFTIQASGSHLSFAWLKAGEALTGEANQSTDADGLTTATLTIAASDYKDDNAPITCVVSNAWNGQNHSVTSGPVTLDVILMPPGIVNQPVDQENVEEFKSATFSVSATGSQLTYQWYRGTELLAGETDHSLTLSDLRFDTHNNTRYHCLVSNTAGEEGGQVTTRKALLTVKRVKPVITEHPEGGMFDEGDKLSLVVTALGSGLVYQWKKDDQPISGATSRDFSIDSVVYADRGNYVCVVSNSLYEVVSDAADVQVMKAAEPELTINIPENMETTDSFVDLSGFASSPDVTIVKVEATNDRFPGQLFGLILHEDGSLTGEVPLAIGENHLTITMILAEGDPITKSMTVTSTLSAVPVITITSPADGTTLTEETVTLSGHVRSSLSPEKIRLLFNGEVYFPTGEGDDYAFSIALVQLVEGPNTLTLVAETPYGNSSQHVVVTYDAGTGIVEENPPEITIHAPASGAWLSNRDISVTGVVHGSAEITSVLVNDTPATMTGAGTDVSFEYSLAFEEGAGNDLSIDVVATDSNGLTSQVEFSVHYDGGPPIIEITSPQLTTSQALYTVKATPFHLTGTIDEGNLSSISLNGAPVTALPQGADLWTFDVAIPLVRLEERDFILEVTDLAGNRSFYGFRMLFDAEIAIAILAPEEGSTLTVSGTEMPLEVKASTPGLGDEEQVVVSVDGGEDVIMERSGITASKTLTVPATQGTRSLMVKALSNTGSLISQQSASFEVANLDDTPVRVVRQDPENGRDDVEPNSFIAFYFNKAVEPSKITLEILETAHGPTWVAQAKGADITSMSSVKPEQVHRDRDPVDGGVSSFPENTMMAFYPEKDMAYGGTVYCRVLNEGVEIHRGTFSVRSMPTLMEGFVADQFMQPVKGIEVELKERKLKTRTNADGYYSFGFGLTASENIEGGLYTVAVNSGMKNLAMGTHEILIGLTEGRLNRAEMIRIPALDTTEPFRYIVSRGGPSDLKNGDLILDFTDADLAFPDGSEEGNVHVQFTVREQIPDPTLDLAVPHWMYALQPRGIITEGETGISMAMPELSGSHDYLADLGQRVLLLGFDPTSKTIVPVGVGSIDHGAKRVVSEGPCRLKALDYIGYCPVPVELQANLDQVVSGDVSMAELIGVIESLK